MIMGRSACPLNPSMTAQIEIEFCGVADFGVHNRAWENVTTPVSGTVVSVIAGKEASVMTFLNHHKSDRWLVIWLK
jgi:dihydroxyacetone kinase-like predicted kinase